VKNFNEMKVLGIIPARGGSKGILNKNLQKIAGRSLVEWAILSTKESLLSKVVVSTDSIEIANEAKKHNIDLVLRPNQLAEDSTRSIDVVHHVLNKIGWCFDAVMLLQPTTPFRSVDDINGSIKRLQQDDIDSVISVANVGGHHPSRMKIISNGELVDADFYSGLDGVPRQELPPVFILNGAIYLSKIHLIRNKKFKGEKCFAWIMPAEKSVNIDTTLDLKLARCIAENLDL
jgi:CMP-N,N'-diacetyllegionaminic acid synthase